MRIKYAVSTMIFWGREHHLSFEQECLFLKSLGFGIELWPNIKGQSDCRYERRNWYRLSTATKDMLVAMRSRNDHPTLEQWKDQIECAKLLGANIVTDLQCLGVPDAPELNGCGFADEIIKMAEDNDVKLCIESGRLPILKMIGEKFDSVRYCLDVGFANLDRKHSFRQYVDDLAPRVSHLHLTDNYGQTDDHEPPGLHGGISRENWDFLLKVLDKYDNDIVGSFEMCPCMPDVMIRKASEYMFDILRWPNRPQKQPSYADVGYNPI